MHKSADAVLTLENLVTEFRTDQGVTRAVDDVGFSVRRGRTLGIVGESGSGKSVTSLSIMRLIPQPPGKIVSGRVLFNSGRAGETEVDLLKLSDAEMRRYRGNRLAMIFQEPMTSLNPVYRCGDQIAEALTLHRGLKRREAREQVIELLKEVDLPRPETIVDQYPHLLSGGQKQRVMIAMAICCSPDVLIADEPTTALDVTVQARILDLLAGLRERHGMGVIFITHDLGVVSDIADEVAVMYKGKVVEYGPVDQIFSDPRHAYTRGLLACRPPRTRRLKRLATVADFLENTAGETPQVETVLQRLEFKSGEAETRRSELNNSAELLRVENLEVHFPIRTGLFNKQNSVVKAVDGISFEVRRGETLGLVGESGCGKTTAGRAILRLIEPTGGNVMFDGRNLADYTKDQMRELRRDVQIVFQDPYGSLNPRFKVGGALLEVLEAHDIKSSRAERQDFVDELLTRVGLTPDHGRHYPHEFSGGQRQRICIARALALNPRFLICDESVSALDVSVQAQVLNLLVDLREEFDLTYIFISHDLSVVRFISDRIAVMRAGKIVELNTAEEIYNNPREEYTRGLIEAIPGQKRAG